jgi:hypothetical protein
MMLQSYHPDIVPAQHLTIRKFEQMPFASPFWYLADFVVQAGRQGQAGGNMLKYIAKTIFY